MKFQYDSPQKAHDSFVAYYSRIDSIKDVNQLKSDLKIITRMYINILNTLSKNSKDIFY